MIEFRCKNCNHLLFKEKITKGKIEIKCPKCKRIVTLKVPDKKS